MKRLVWLCCLLVLCEAGVPVVDPSLGELACRVHPRRVFFDGVCYRADPVHDPCETRVVEGSATLPGWVWCLQGPECALNDTEALTGCLPAPLVNPDWYARCRTRDGVAKLSSAVEHCLKDETCQWSLHDDACVPRWEAFCKQLVSKDQCGTVSNCVWLDSSGACVGTAADEEPCNSVATATDANLPFGRGEGACAPFAPYLALMRNDSVEYFNGFDAGHWKLCTEELSTGSATDCALMDGCVFDGTCRLSVSSGGCRYYDWPTKLPVPRTQACTAAGCTLFSAHPEPEASLSGHEVCLLEDAVELPPEVGVSIVDHWRRLDPRWQWIFSVFVVFMIIAFIGCVCIMAAPDDRVPVKRVDYVVKRTRKHLHRKHSRR